MSWIKRNLTFVIGGIVALGLLGAAGFYIYQSWNANGDARDKLNETYNALDALTKKNPSPGNEQVNNIAIAAEQRGQLSNWMASVTGYFQPIPPIPEANAADSSVFRSALAQTIKDLQDSAGKASVTLPSNYGFSFEVYRNQLNLPTLSLGALAVQLGEVKAITGIMLAARVNGLDSIQRLRIADNDTSGPANDYLDDHAVTNDLGVLTPYAVTFHSFTPEIAKVLAGFAGSPNAFIVKSISVDRAGSANGPDNQAGGPNPQMAPNPFGGMLGGPMPPGAFGGGPFGRPQPVAPAPVVSAKGGLPTVLKEQMLKITLQLEVVKLLPKK